VIPIELVWFIIVLLFGLIGLVRGYLRELGVTTVMVVVLFGIMTVEGKLLPILARLANWAAETQLIIWQTGLWVVGLIFTAFISYHGETLAFEGTQPKGTLGQFLNLGSGLVNGYLIVGGIWYYLDRLGYPLLRMGHDDLSPFARQLLALMPPSLLAPYLLYVAIFLVLMRVVR
jgi:hypothetical protein